MQAHTIINSIIAIISVLLITSPLLISTLIETTTTTQDGATSLREQLALLSYFQVESRAVLFGRESTTIDAEVRALERYSNEHGRARLEFQFQEFATPNGRTRSKGHLASSPQVQYIFSAQANQLMRISEMAPTGTRFACDLSNRTALAGDLFGLDGGEGDSRAPELTDWERLLSDPRMPSHVIGFARLLVFVELNGQEFRRVERSRGATVRNAEVEQFKFTFKVAEWAGQENSRWVAPIEGKEATILIYQNKESGAEGPAGHPFRIWFKLPSRAELFVEFSSVGPVRPAAITGTSSLQGVSGDLMGLFNFPLGRGCSQHLSESGVATIGSHSPPPPPPPVARSKTASQAVFSFEMELSELWFRERPTRLGALFVAYDAHAKALRVDSYAEPETTTTIYDFVLGRKYHLRTGGGGGSAGELQDPSPSGSVMEPVEGSQDSRRRRQCLVTRILAKEREDLQGETETILPWGSLTEMGSALVRGIETRVYEHVSERLPRFIFQQVAYLDSAGEEQLAFNFKRKFGASTTRADGDTTQSVRFSIVYFIAATTTSGGGGGNAGDERDNQLIRVDVYKSDVLLYRADVYNFHWHLTDAPDGQPEEELFSLGDAAECLLPPNVGTPAGGILLRPPARMQLELVYVENAQMFHALSPVIIDLLASSSARNKALIRSLAGYPSNSLFASQMRDLKTTIRGLEAARNSADSSSSSSLDSIKLVADVELAGLSRVEDIALSAVYIGTALSSGAKKPSAKSMTLEQCFWEAASEFAFTGNGPSGTSAVLFSFCSSKCWIDSRATVSMQISDAGGPLEYHSSVFQVSIAESRQLPCELLRIQRDTTTRLPTGDRELVRPWRDVQQNLRDKILSLVFVNEQQQQSSGSKTCRQPELLFKVSKVALTDSDQQVGEQPQVVDGVSLPAEVSLATFQIGSPDALDQAPEACHARCVAHLDCRSYSICHGQQRVDCVISALELDTSELLKQRDKYYKLDRQSSERKADLISVVVPAAAVVGTATTADREARISLRVNRRCQVRTIRAQEMFALREREYGATGRTVWQTHLMPVANPAECAQMCLRKNVNFFQRLANLRPANLAASQNVPKSSREAGEKPVELRDQLSYTMRFWCHAFYYLDTKLEPVSYQLLGKLRKTWAAAKTVAPTTGAGGDGLCYLARPEWAPTDYTTPRAKSTEIPNTTDASKDHEAPTPRDEQKLELVKLPFKEHEFRYSLLYERHQGFRLARTSANHTPPGGPIDIANNQSIESHPPDIEFCARKCFSQTAHWCRSFDVITFAAAVAADRSPARSLSCIYNSLSLRDSIGADNSTGLLLRQQMGVAQKSHTVSYDHYEPHKAYALDNVAMSYLNEFDTAQQQQQQQQPLSDLGGHLSPQQSRKLLNLIVCILMGLCTGSAVALLLMKHVYHKDHLPRHVRSHMDVPRLSREFICMEE